MRKPDLRSQFVFVAIGLLALASAAAGPAQAESGILGGTLGTIAIAPTYPTVDFFPTGYQLGPNFTEIPVADPLGGRGFRGQFVYRKAKLGDRDFSSYSLDADISLFDRFDALYSNRRTRVEGSSGAIFRGSADEFGVRYVANRGEDKEIGFLLQLNSVDGTSISSSGSSVVAIDGDQIKLNAVRTMHGTNNDVHQRLVLARTDVGTGESFTVGGGLGMTRQAGERSSFAYYGTVFGDFGDGDTGIKVELGAAWEQRFGEGFSVGVSAVLDPLGAPQASAIFSDAAMFTAAPITAGNPAVANAADDPVGYLALYFAYATPF